MLHLIPKKLNIQLMQRQNIFSLSLSLGFIWLLPYMKTFLPIEWPWKSQKKKISLDS